MARPRSTEPTYCLHRPSGRAYVRLDGRRVYLGRHGTPASRDAYHRALAEWTAAGRRDPAATAATPGTPAALIVAEVIDAFWQHAKSYYARPDGEPGRGGEIDNFRLALRPLNRLYGTTAAAAFGPLALKALRSEMARLGWSRTYVNRQVARVRQAFKWAAENELIPAAVYQALATVAGLRKGRGGEAREPEPVRPVPDAHVDAVLPFCASPVRAMVRLQRLTGMRPGEAVVMRGCDLDTSGDVWVYRPAAHKTAHHGHAREIFIGPRAKDVLKPFLRPDLSAFLFSPRDALAEKYARGPGARRGQKPQAPKTARKVRERYDVGSYRQAIERACDLAFPPPAELARQRLERRGRVAGSRRTKPRGTRWESVAEWRARIGDKKWAALAEWRSEHRWHPHQLRHNAGTELRRRFGMDAARTILGHRSPAVTSVYAEADADKAARIMGEVG